MVGIFIFKIIGNKSKKWRGREDRAFAPSAAQSSSVHFPRLVYVTNNGESIHASV